VDVFNGTIIAERSFLRFANYLVMFPKLTQGPITRYSQVQDALTETKRVDFALLMQGTRRFITGLEVTEVATELSKIVAGRAINDNANLLLRFSNGARGTLWASMAAVGNEHGLRIRVYGDRGSLAWHQEDPHHLLYSPIDGAPQILAQGAEWLSPDAARWTRAGLGHPEGFFEAFANLYTEVADALLAKAEGRPFTKSELGFSDASDGLKGVAFVEAAMRSYAGGGAWTALEIN
jgi:predicted dehydrogenase